jgi:hypothetical protein
MMKLLGVAFLSCIVTSLISVFSMSLGRGQPQVELIAGLRMCDDTPCYFDIVPGKTPWNDAVTTLKNIPGTLFDEDINIAYHPPDLDKMYMSRGVLLEEYVAKELALNPEIGGMNLADVVTRFGIPCCLVKVPDVRGDLILIKFAAYPRLGAFIALERFNNRWIIQSTSPVKQLLLCPPDPDKGCMIWFGYIPNVLRWRGFANYRVPRSVN